MNAQSPYPHLLEASVPFRPAGKTDIERDSITPCYLRKPLL